MARQYKTFTRVGVRAMPTTDDLEALIVEIKKLPKPEYQGDPCGTSRQADPSGYRFDDEPVDGTRPGAYSGMRTRHAILDRARP